MNGIGNILFAFLAAPAAERETYVNELRGAPSGWTAVGGLALVALLLWAVIWMYRREGRLGASMRTRMFLACLRCLVLVALAVIFLEPVRVRIIRRWIDSYALVLIDDSASMDLADRYRDPAAASRAARVLGGDADHPTTRRALVEQILARDERKFLRDLVRNNRVKLYSFSDAARPIANLRASRESAGPAAESQAPASTDFVDLKDVPLDFPAAGPATNLDLALRRGVESLGTVPIAGVVVFTDGGINQGGATEQIAQYAKERKIPLQIVGIGDPSPPRNLRVTEVLAPDNAFQKDPFAVSATIAAEGVEGESVRVELRERNADDPGTGSVVDSRDILFTPGMSLTQVSFERRQGKVGRYTYSVEAVPLSDESIVEDNTRQASVNVIDSKTKVLIVAGSPSWDYRFVTTLLERDATIDVSCWLQSADLSAVRDGDIVIDHLPTTPEELFAYDVILLLDPDKTDIDEDWCRLVDQWVSENGGGLLYEAARAHSPTFLRDPTHKPLWDLLPVTLDPEADLVLNQIGHYQTSPSSLEISPAAFSHPILRFGEDAAAGRIAWQGMGDVYWHYPVLREKPVATVLLRQGNPRMRNTYGGHVLCATQFVGAGRTAFLGFDGTWRWRRFDQPYYDRFWIQTVRYLSEGKLLGGSKRATLLVENERPTLGETVNVTARLLDARFEPLRIDQVPVQVRIEDQRRDFTLTPRRDRLGWFEGRFVPDRAGAYRLHLTLPEGGVTPIEVEREVVVSRSNLETLHPQMNKSELIALAEGSQGGKYWEIDEAGDIPAAIPDLHEEVPIRSRPTSLWDNGTVLALLVGLLTIEWAVRKWTRLL